MSGWLDVSDLVPYAVDLYRSGEKKLALASMVNLAVEDLMKHFGGAAEVSAPEPKSPKQSKWGAANKVVKAVQNKRRAHQIAAAFKSGVRMTEEVGRPCIAAALFVGPNGNTSSNRR